MLAYYEHKSKLAKRAYLPKDQPDERWHYAIAGFVAEHDETLHAYNLSTGKVGKAETRTIGDSVILPHCSYEFHMSVCKSVHVLRDEDAAEIERLDREIAQLMEQRQAVLDESFKRGRALHQRDVDPNWDGNQ